MGICIGLPGLHNKIPINEWLKQQQFISHSSGAWKSKITVSAGWASPEDSLLGLLMAAFSLSSHMVLPLHVHIPGISLWVPMSSSSGL